MTMGGLGELIVAAALFVGGHFVASSATVREPLAARLGEPVFTGLYSLAALALLVWTIMAYGRAPGVPLWDAPSWTYTLPAIFMAPACLLLVCGVSQDNPTAAMRRLGPGDRPAPGILAVTRHPVMWGIGIWALAHVPANGTAADLVLFGAVAALALGGTRAIDGKKRRAWGADWDRFAAATSNLPFAALAAGHAKLDPAEIGWLRVVGAATLYALLVFFHPFIAGVPVPGFNPAVAP